MKCAEQHDFMNIFSESNSRLFVWDMYERTSVGILQKFVFVARWRQYLRPATQMVSRHNNSPEKNMKKGRK